MHRSVASSSQAHHSGIPADVLPHVLHDICCQSQQSPKDAQRALCALLCTSRSISAAAARHCQGLLHVRLHAGSSSKRALQFAGWLRKHVALVKQLHLNLPGYSKEVEQALAAAVSPATEADAAGWLRRHKALVSQELPPDLAQYSKEMERRIAAAQKAAADAYAAGSGAHAAAGSSGGVQCQVQLQSYICHTRWVRSCV
jgi:hypothetical protein